MNFKPTHRVRRFAVALASVVILCLITALAPAAPNAVKKAKLGEPVPEFALRDLKGKDVDFLKKYRGKTVVMQWFNPDCPFVVNVYNGGAVASTLEAIKKMGDDYAFVAINSTATKPREYMVSSSDAFLKQYKVDVSVLIDEDGSVGRLYDARTTPQMFVVEKGVLRYSGAFTDNPWGKRDKTVNYVVNALNQLKASETVSPDYVKPWGCSVKYRK